MNPPFALGIIALYLTMFAGWVLNILDLVHSLSGPVTALFIARIAGVPFFPLGALLGFFS